MLNITFKRVLFTGNGFIVNKFINNTDVLLYTDNFAELDQANVNTSFICDVLKASITYVVCGNSQNLEVFSNNSTNLLYQYTINSFNLQMPTEFIDYSIYLDNFLCMVINKNLLVIVDLSSVQSSFIVPLANITLLNPAKLILASENQLYIIYEDDTMEILSNLEYFHIKSIALPPFSLISLIGDYIVALTDETLTVINGLDYACNSIISQIPIDP